MIGRKVVPPENVCRALEALLGEQVRDVAVIEHSLFARLHLRIEATTRRRRIYLVGSGESFFDNPGLMLHEYCHVLKQWETGDLTTLRYIVESFRRGYWKNRYEIEARQFAWMNLGRFRKLMMSEPQPSNASR